MSSGFQAMLERKDKSLSGGKKKRNSHVLKCVFGRAVKLAQFGCQLLHPVRHS